MRKHQNTNKSLPKAKSQGTRASRKKDSAEDGKSKCEETGRNEAEVSY